MSSEKYLWVDQYRPKFLADYVWADESQRQQVQNWVREKHLPNLLLSGGPGIGKCLGGNERINIRLDKSKLTPAQLAYLDAIKLEKK